MGTDLTPISPDPPAATPSSHIKAFYKFQASRLGTNIQTL